ncbi:FAD-dependent oxidoreductase [Siminovitchia terrae]|uniref:FAD-dependent oxidoreductase n=1 Tax=Siminovitchia terrae TaxID=1914933 RepID=A0A429XAV0_SIMTE|nr:NAD(P)/FAD-dependent oxidoreductase [Siminovitchia terrae]RST60536.1 FAD-dependent oxidoreductase [Siminovitchia terrae]
MGKSVTEVYDAIIIGAGFAGLTAARELEMLGRSVLILEARERLGGRTWMDRRLGCDLELGGTYVHWYQPHLWSELTRYNLDIFEAEPAKKAYWITDRKVKSGTMEELRSILNESYERMMKEVTAFYPFPFEMQKNISKEFDSISISEFIEKFDLTKEQQDLISSSMGINYSGPPEEGAATQMFRWWAFSQGNRAIFTDTAGRFKIKGGTRALVEAIASDVEAEIKYSSVVSSVENNDGNMGVQTKDGEIFYSKTAIVTVPLSTLDKIDFKPALSELKQAFISEKQVSKGVKVWARIKGVLEPFVTYAPVGYPLQSIYYESQVEGDTIVVGFGSDANRLNLKDRDAVEQAIRLWLPEVEVMEVTGHDWTNDEFSKETWPMLKPNQLTSYVEEMRRPENGLYLAGTTYANGWAGFIDGAIENAINTGRKVHHYLKKEDSCLKHKDIF